MKKKTISFTDTMFLTTKDRRHFGLSKTKNSLVFKADLENGSLDFGYEIYDVKRNNDDEIILADAQYYHVFEREYINKEHQNAPINQKTWKLQQVNYSLLNTKTSKAIGRLTKNIKKMGRMMQSPKNNTFVL